jgi:uncharacterized protein (TIGR00251 family)
MAPAAYPEWKRFSEGDLYLTVRVQPNSFTDSIEGIHNNALKIKIAAKPTGGKANKHLVAYLAKQLKVPRASISITRGHSARDKQILVKQLPLIPDWLDVLCRVR